MSSIQIRTRREFLATSALGMGSVALACLLRQENLLAAPHMSSRGPFFRPEAQEPAGAGQGPGHDLAVHARRPQPRRFARSQA